MALPPSDVQAQVKRYKVELSPDISSASRERLHKQYLVCLTLFSPRDDCSARTYPLTPMPRASVATQFRAAQPVPDAGTGSRPITRSYTERNTS